MLSGLCAGLSSDYEFLVDWRHCVSSIDSHCIKVLTKEAKRDVFSRCVLPIHIDTGSAALPCSVASLLSNGAVHRV